MNRPDLVDHYKCKLFPGARFTDITLTVTDTIISVLQIVEAIHEAEDNLRLVPRW